jgi:transposase
VEALLGFHVGFWDYVTFGAIAVIVMAFLALVVFMLIVGYVFTIRSERALCRDVQVNFAYRWFCGLSIEDKVPDHSVFSRARNERFRDSGIFHSVFERVVNACIRAGLVGGEGFAVDASLIVADGRRRRAGPAAR